MSDPYMDAVGDYRNALQGVVVQRNELMGLLREALLLNDMDWSSDPAVHRRIDDWVERARKATAHMVEAP